MSEPFEIRSRRGHRLAGRLERPEGDAKGWAVFAHCFTCDKDSHAAVRICRGLAAAGIGALRFDFSGLGDSEGSFGEGLSQDAGDVADAVDAMRAAGMPVGLLIGHSFGGAAVLAAAGGLPDVKAVVTLGAPFDAEHVLQHVKAGPLAGRAAKAKIAGRLFNISPRFVEDLKTQDQAARLRALKRPLLVLHAPLDQTVGVENAAAIFNAARHPKSFVSLDRADHLLTDADDAAWVARLIADWAGRYLEPL